MPHRRSRRFLIILFLAATLAFLEHAPLSPVQGKLSSYGYPVKLAKVTNSSIKNISAISQANNDENAPLRITVMTGDTLSTLADKYFTTVQNIVRENNLTSPDRIIVGQKLLIVPASGQQFAAEKVIPKASNPSHETLIEGPYDSLMEAEHKSVKVSIAFVQKEVTEVGSTSRGKYANISREDLDLLARVIHAEARGEDLEGQIAVAAVILNRLEDPRFPKTIREVIYQPYAFTAVADKQIHLSPNDAAYQAAAEALAGKDPTNGALYYYNPRTATDTWIKGRPVVKQIGNHTFSI